MNNLNKFKVSKNKVATVGKHLNWMSILFLVGSLLMLAGCSNGLDKYTYTSYKELKKPEKEMKLNSTVVVNESDVNVLNDFALLKDYVLVIDRQADKFIKIFDLKSRVLLKSFGKRGQGPGEFIQPVQIIPCPKDEGAFWIFDISTKLLKKYNIDDVLDNKFKPEKNIHLKEENGVSIWLIITSDNKILGDGIYSHGRINIFTMDGDLIRTIGKIPVKLKQDRFAAQHSHGFLGRFIYKNRSKEIFIATIQGSIVEEYNIGGGLLATFHGPDTFFPEYDIVPVQEYYTITRNKKSRFGYIDICYCEKTDRLFLLYSGKYAKDDKLANSSRTIYVLDSSGTITEQLVLDKRVFHIKISEDGSILFGVTPEMEILTFEFDKE